MIKKIALLFVFNLCLITGFSQSYLNVNNMTGIGVETDVEVIEDFLSGRGYYANGPSGLYRDSKGNTVSFGITKEQRNYVHHIIQVNSELRNIIEKDMDDYSYLEKIQGNVEVRYTTNGTFILALEKGKEHWDIYFRQILKSDVHLPHSTRKNRLNINSYTNAATKIWLNKGDNIELRASDQIKLGDWVGSGGPNGIEGYSSYSIVPNLKHGSLIGKIGDGDWFFVGAYASFKAPTKGYLTLRVNDNDPSNNVGFFVVDYLVK